VFARIWKTNIQNLMWLIRDKRMAMKSSERQDWGKYIFGYEGSQVVPTFPAGKGKVSRSELEHVHGRYHYRIAECLRCL
jgi:hypothetical protein